MDAMRLSIRLWGILFHSSRSAISKSRTVTDGLGRAAMRRPSMSQTGSIGFRSESTLAIPYAVLLQLQACSLPDELYAVGIIILENKGISNGYIVRDDIRSKYLVCIPSARQSAIPNDMQVRTSAYADSTPIPSNQLFCIVIFHERMRGYFECPCPSIQEHVGCHSLD
ncbi:hypothetical protein TNCV_216791 [Trichonephila clavipes]|nr:hypothetical protein TNCV_216791 [Trichonephila clavipes]